MLFLVFPGGDGVGGTLGRVGDGQEVWCGIDVVGGLGERIKIIVALLEEALGFFCVVLPFN